MSFCNGGLFERGGGVGEDVKAAEISASTEGLFTMCFFEIEGFVESGGLGGGCDLWAVAVAMVVLGFDISGRAGIGGAGDGVFLCF